MGALDDLASYLVLGQAQQQGIAQSDPYSGGASLGNSLLQSVMQDTIQRPEASSMKERIALAALTGLGGGLFGGLSDNYRARASDAYQGSVVDSILGRSSEKPSVLSSSLFADAKQRGSLFKVQQALEDRKLQNEIEKLTQVENAKSANELDRGVMLEIAKNPYRAEKILAAVGAASGKGPAQMQPIGQPASENKLDPYLTQYGGDEAAARSALEYDRNKPQRDLEMTDALRREFTGRPEVKTFQEVANRFNVMKQAFADPSKISDYDFAVNLAKIFDPTSVVRESESGQVIDSQSIPSAVLGRLNQATSGGAALDLPTRLTLMQAAARHFDTQKQGFDAIRNRYSEIASQRGLQAPNIDVIGLPSAAVDPAGLKALALQFPQTPEGRSQFKAAAALLGAGAQ